MWLKRLKAWNLSMLFLTFFYCSCESSEISQNKNVLPKKHATSHLKSQSSELLFFQKYKNVDSSTQLIDCVSYTSIFQFHNTKYAFKIDTNARLYQSTSDCIKQVIQLNWGNTCTKPSIIKNKDYNNDGINDLLIKSSTGGTAGDEYLLFLYNPITKTLIHDPSIELRNISYKNQIITVKYMWSEAKYQVDQFALKKIENTTYLRFSGNPDFKDLIEITTFDDNEKVITIDTLNINKL